LLGFTTLSSTHSLGMKLAMWYGQIYIKEALTRDLYDQIINALTLTRRNRLSEASKKGMPFVTLRWRSNSIRVGVWNSVPDTEIERVVAVSPDHTRRISKYADLITKLHRDYRNESEELVERALTEIRRSVLHSSC